VQDIEIVTERKDAPEPSMYIPPDFCNVHYPNVRTVLPALRNPPTQPTATAHQQLQTQLPPSQSTAPPSRSRIRTTSHRLVNEVPNLYCCRATNTPPCARQQSMWRMCRCGMGSRSRRLTLTPIWRSRLNRGGGLVRIKVYVWFRHGRVTC
jgi:hypothetical protein